MPARTAFVYDFLLVRGGAEQLSLHVKRTHPEMDAVFGFVEPGAFPPNDFPPAKYHRLTSPSRVQGWQGLKVMSAFRRRGQFLADYDTVIFSGVYAPEGVHHRPNGRNIYYCHTPPRFVYDLRDHYLDLARPWQKPLLKALIPYVRRRYEEAIGRMDRLIANSHNVKTRLQHYLGQTDVDVLYPPVPVEAYRWLSSGDYYLSTARLEPYKRVDLIIDAFKRMPERKLVVASDGSELDKLRHLAHGHANISFTGWVGDAELKRLLGNCIASIYLPRDEDFGISPVESMAAGKPVIAVNEGGLTETVLHGQTGILLSPEQMLSRDQAVAALIEAVLAGESECFNMRTACESRASKFSTERFDVRIQELLE